MDKSGRFLLVKQSPRPILRFHHLHYHSVRETSSKSPLRLQLSLRSSRFSNREKTGEVIYRGISLELWNKLQEHARDKLPEAWLFLDEFGKPYSQGRLYDIWVRACKKIGVKISLYRGTRHSRASQKRLEKEKEIAEACRKELGHSSKTTTMKHYARARKEELK